MRRLKRDMAGEGDSDLITVGDVVKKIPGLLKRLPSFARGVYFLKLKNPTKTYSIGWALERNAKKYPENDAIRYNDYSITYDELNAWANRMASYFLHRDISKGDVVAVYLENRPEMLAVISALSKVGAIAAVVNTQQTGKVLHHSMSLVTPKFYVIGEELTHPFEEIRDQLENTQVNNVFYLADKNTIIDPGAAPSSYTNLGKVIEEFSQENPVTTKSITVNDPCFYIYTSGTTGLPKAVITTHGKWMKSYGGYGLFAANLTPRDCVYITLPLYHGAALVITWSVAMAAGCPVALRKKFSASNFWRDMKKFEVTVFAYIGEVCRYLMNQVPSPEEYNNSVKTVIGSGLRPYMWNDFKTRFGIEKVIEYYGSSEGNVGFVNALNFENTVGYSPAPYAIVKCDPETAVPFRDSKGCMTRCSIGEPGLMIGRITREWPFVGYTDKAKSQQAILHNVFERGDRWYNSGDLMRNIGCKHAQFVDRLGDTYRWKGENVSTAEIESLANQLPMVQESVAYGVEVPFTNGRAGMISLVPSKDAVMDIESLFHNFESCMPSYAIPLFIRLKGSLDKTGTFKYKKTDVKRQGFNINQVADPLFVLLPNEKTYRELTTDIYSNILNNQYRF